MILFGTLKTQRHKAFTLPEILITLGIIGVVAVITIIPLMNKTNDEAFINGLKTNYSILQQAFNSLLNDNSNTAENLCTSGDNSCFRDKLGDYMQFIKTCNTGVTGCWTTGSLTCLIKRPMNYYIYQNMPTAVLKNGSTMSFQYGDSTCNSTWYSQIDDFTVCGVINIDVNGVKPPNIQGRDIYMFWVQKDKITPFGTKGDDFDGKNGDYCNTNASFDGNGYACTAKYLYNKQN